MSEIRALRTIEKPCCALRFAVWRWRITRGKATDSTWFGCEACGGAYRLTASGWEKVTALSSLVDMVKNDPRGHLS